MKVQSMLHIDNCMKKQVLKAKLFQISEVLSMKNENIEQLFSLLLSKKNMMIGMTND